MAEVGKTVDVRLPEQAWEHFREYPGNVRVKVRTKGMRQTKQSVIQKEIDMIESESTVAGVLKAAADAQERWNGKECFAEVVFDGPQPSREGGNHFFVDYRIREAGNVTFGVMTDAQELAPEIRCSHTNILGRGYSGYVELQPTAKKEQAEEEQRQEWNPVMQSFRVGCRSNAPWVGRWTEYFCRHQKPAISRNVLSDETALEGGARVGWGGPWVHTVGLTSESRNADAVTDEHRGWLRECGEDSSIGKFESHTLSWESAYDRRTFHTDSELRSNYPHPTGGYGVWTSLKASGSFAGLQASSGFDTLRAETKTHKLWNLANMAVASLCFRFGGMYSATPAHLSHRMYIERDVVRGHPRVGEVMRPPSAPEGRDAGLRGGSMLAAASLGLAAPLPVPGLPKGLLGVHTYLDVGTVAAEPRGEQTWEDTIARGSAASAGVGLMLTALPVFGQMGRLELNAGVNVPLPGSLASQRDFSGVRLGLSWVV
eukprot:TRINITY_DN26128_c0_g1_i1.p1 TRINITY_DN26128_c0_g1~~TRINITY_DN26128_c0_g1_i1.p1  ORF type:complete len:510 (+),score=110.94 TRINITY_DN26128_c0_g1_i1:77-1531(+)